MQWILLILLAIVVLTVVSFLIAALKWLLIIAAILVFVALVTRATSGRKSSLRSPRAYVAQRWLVRSAERKSHL